MTHAELENPGDLFANVARTILLADTPAWPFTPYAHRFLGVMDNNRVEIQATGFARASDHMDFANIANVSTPFYNHRKGHLSFSVVSQRTDQAATDNHAYCVGRVGYLCDRTAQKFTADACSGLIVLNLADLGDSQAVDEKTDADRTMRGFEIEYIIPAAVFAAAT